MCPADIIQAVNICLIDLLFRSPRNTFQLIILILVYQKLSARYPYNTSVCARLIALLVIDRLLCYGHVHDSGQFIQQGVSLIPQFIGHRPIDLYQVDLLIHRCQILRDGINMIDTYLNLIVDIRLQILQVPVHIIEVIRHTLGYGYKASLIGIAAAIRRNILQCRAKLVEDRFKPGLTVIRQIFLYHLAIIGFRVEFAKLRLILPEFLIIKLIPDTLDRQRIDTGSRTAVG